MVRSRLRATAVLAVLAAACLNALAQSDTPRWDTFAQAADRPRLSTPQNAALLVFLRALDAPELAQAKPMPTDILIDGRFHTALLPGGFSEALVCPGIAQLQVGGQATNGLRNKPSTLIEVRPGSVNYIRVAQPNAAQIFVVQAAATTDALRDLRRQVHARSRLPETGDCRLSIEPENLLAMRPPTTAVIPAPTPAPAALIALAPPLAAAPPAPNPPAPAAAPVSPPPPPLPPPVAVPPPPPLQTVAAAPAQADPEPPAAPAAEPTPLKRRHNFSAELLFRFGGYRVEDLTSQGHAEIVKLARVIKEQSRQVQSVLVQGHTDPMGPAASNLRISRERAETVRKILLNSGLPARKVQAEGRGSSDLLVTDCKPKATSRQDRLACNAPNRRVEILVINNKN